MHVARQFRSGKGLFVNKLIIQGNQLEDRKTTFMRIKFNLNQINFTISNKVL